MQFKQCVFRTIDGEPDDEVGGISVYRFGNFLGVICLCCGNWCSAKRALVIEEYPGWMDLSEIMMSAAELAELWPYEEDDE